MATSKPSKVDSETFFMRPSKAERYKIEREKDAQFAKIPEDLITEYFDLKDERKGIEEKATKEINYIKESRKHKLNGNSVEQETNFKKLESISGLKDWDLYARLKKDGVE